MLRYCCPTITEESCMRTRWDTGTFGHLDERNVLLFYHVLCKGDDTLRCGSSFHFVTRFSLS